MTARLF
jgi:hypothetical protein